MKLLMGLTIANYQLLAIIKMFEEENYLLLPSLLQSSRDQAYQRMLDDAAAKGANAIICFRFQTSTITQGASEILAYGTGVKIKK